MSPEANMHAVSVAEGGPLFGLSIPVPIFQTPEVGNAGQEHMIIQRQYAGSRAGFHVVKLVGKHCCTVGSTVPVDILKQPDAVVPFCIVLDPLAMFPLVHGDSIRDRAAGQIIFETCRLRIVSVAKGFDNEDATMWINTQSNRVGKHRFGSK